jgi:threonine aldolase
LLDGPRGVLSSDDVASAINSDDIHYPQTALVALENTVNKGGGAYYTLNQIKSIKELCQKHQLPLHLDGARVFNALTASGDSAMKYGKYFDTISVCLSKGLGAPVGSVLVGSEALIKKAKRVRKVFGGGMRQAGYLAAAGTFALDHHVQRLTDDHKRSKILEEELRGKSFVDEVFPVDTNIIIFSLRNMSTDTFLNAFQENGILAIPFGKNEIRMVTHLEFDDDGLEKVVSALKKMDRKPV